MLHFQPENSAERITCYCYVTAYSLLL